MKCEQHGVEMEWRGSLAAGRMYCEQCASTGGRSYADIAKELLGGFDMAAPGTTDKTASEIYRDALANSKPRRMKAPRPAYDPYKFIEIEQRVAAAEYMIREHDNGRVARCPYCNNDVPPDHTVGVNACRRMYYSDKDYLRACRP